MEEEERGVILGEHRWGFYERGVLVVECWRLVWHTLAIVNAGSKLCHFRHKVGLQWWAEWRVLRDGAPGRYLVALFFVKKKRFLLKWRGLLNPKSSDFFFFPQNRSKVSVFFFFSNVLRWACMPKGHPLDCSLVVIGGREYKYSPNMPQWGIGWGIARTLRSLGKKMVRTLSEKYRTR